MPKPEIAKLRPRGARLLRFAVVTDTHVNHAEDETTSPWPVNRLANGRVRHAFRAIKAYAPAFVVHVGDMVHPVPTQPLYGDAVARFREIARELVCPLHLTPGNHDIGDKAVPWSAAAAMTEETLAVYEHHFGRTYYGFAHADCRFLVLNSLLINSGLAGERGQRQWLEDELARAATGNGRIFVFLHDPPFTTAPDEGASYDNLVEPGRSWLLDLLARHRVEAVFSGHVHNFWYNKHAETELYILPSTTFVRQDYAELYRVEPGPENGRNDPAKLGFALVDVHAHGHVVHIVRTHGAGQSSADPVVIPPLSPLVHTRSADASPVGVDLRHPWAEVSEIAPSGGVDEFGRKYARNDYPVQALWEMGIGRVRVPLQDLLRDATRARMRLMRDMGMSFTVYSYDVPMAADCGALIAHADLVAALEIVLPEELIGARLATIGELRANGGPPVIISKLIRHHGKPSHGVFAHAINHGFLVDEEDEIRSLLTAGGARNAVSGLVFRIGRGEAPLASLTRVSELAGKFDLLAEAHVRLAGENPAEAFNDDLANACRVAETVVAARQLGNGASVLLDTFEDVDRSFFARTGLVDRRFNPRAAGRVFRTLRGLEGILASQRVTAHDEGPGFRTLKAASGRWLLALPSAPAAVEGTWLASRLAGDGDQVVCADLVTGMEAGVPSPHAAREPGINRHGTMHLGGPCLFYLSRTRAAGNT